MEGLKLYHSLGSDEETGERERAMISAKLRIRRILK